MYKVYRPSLVWVVYLSAKDLSCFLRLKYSCFLLYGTVAKTDIHQIALKMALVNIVVIHEFDFLSSEIYELSTATMASSQGSRRARRPPVIIKDKKSLLELTTELEIT